MDNARVKTKQCPKCRGSGVVVDYLSQYDVKCSRCKGTGFVPYNRLDYIREWPDYMVSEFMYSIASECFTCGMQHSTSHNKNCPFGKCVNSMDGMKKWNETSSNENLEKVEKSW